MVRQKAFDGKNSRNEGGRDRRCDDPRGGAALIAAPPALALTASIPISPFVVWYPRFGNVGNSNYPQGNFTNNIVTAPGTSLSGAVTAVSYQYAWQTTNNHVFTTGAHGPVDTGAAAAAGTSPSLITFADGTWHIAYQNSQHHLASVTAAGAGDWTYPMDPDSSPSIARTPAKNAVGTVAPFAYTIAFEGSDDTLNIFGLNGLIRTGIKMAPGTNPSITWGKPDPNVSYPNFRVAYHAANGHMATYDGATKQVSDSGVPMADHASPAIRMAWDQLNLAFPVAFRAAGNNLYFVDGLNGVNDGHDTGLPMMDKTNPSLMISPVNLPPRTDLTGRSGYVAYVAATTGLVSAYGLNYFDRTRRTLNLGQTATASTPSIVSQLNWVDGAAVIVPESGVGD